MICGNIYTPLMKKVKKIMSDEPELNADALTAAHIAVEDVLIEMRDSRLSMLGPANGFIVKEQDGTSSSIMRLGTRDGLSIGIKAYLAAIAKAPSKAEES